MIWTLRRLFYRLRGWQARRRAIARLIAYTPGTVCPRCGRSIHAPRRVTR